MNTYTVIVPAAGASRRMGHPKLVLPLRDRTIIEWTLAALSADRVVRLVVVVDPRDEVLRRIVAEHPKTEVAINEAPELGMLSSILAGLDALGSRDHDHILVCPGDLPALQRATVHAVIECHRSSRALLVVPSYRQKRGHPLLIDAALVSRIPRLDSQIGLRQITEDPEHRVHEVAVEDSGCLRDVDTPEDYYALNQQLATPES